MSWEADGQAETDKTDLRKLESNEWRKKDKKQPNLHGWTSGSDILGNSGGGEGGAEPGWL